MSRNRKAGQTTPTDGNVNFTLSDAGLLAIEELKKDFRDSFEKLRSELLAFNEKLSSEVNKLKLTVHKLENQVKEKDITISNLSIQLNTLDQYGRNRNLEIENVEYRRDESVEDIVLNLAKVLNLNIVKSDIDAAHRLPSRKTDRPQKIIVQLVSRKKRDAFLVKKKSGITSDQLVSGGKQKLNIYINENLTPSNREVLWAAKQRARELQYKFVWVKQGKIFARQDENQKIIKILSLSDIDKFIV